MKRRITGTMVSIMCMIGVTAGMLTACGSPASQPQSETAIVETLESEQAVGMANPWIDVSAEALGQKTGFVFNVPEGAENVIYRLLESDNLAEMQFTLDGKDYNARMKSTSGVEDISGHQGLEVNYIGESVDNQQIFFESDDQADYCIYLYYDIVPGVMECLSVSAETIEDGYNILDITEQVFPKFQGEVG